MTERLDVTQCLDLSQARQAKHKGIESSWD
jgi:hypothetical protein